MNRRRGPRPRKRMVNPGSVNITSLGEKLLRGSPSDRDVACAAAIFWTARIIGREKIWTRSTFFSPHDLAQQAAVEALLLLRSYDPGRAKLTTYMKYAGIKAASDICRTTGEFPLHIGKLSRVEFDGDVAEEAGGVPDADDWPLHAALASLNDQQRTVISARFGLRGDEPATLRELGRRLGLTAERIRQIEAGALDKMRRFLLNRKENY